MPLGLAMHIPGWPAVDHGRPTIIAALAAARSCIRRRGYTLAAAHAAARACRAGASERAYNRGAAAAWFAAEAVALAVGWPGQSSRPGRLTLVLATWAPGGRANPSVAVALERDMRAAEASWTEGAASGLRGAA